MARPLRLEIANGLYHVSCLGVDETAVFRGDDDRVFLLDMFSRTVRRYGWSCLAYCQMTTHYHLVVRIRRENLALGMQYLNGRYGQAFNHRHDRKGHLFGGRYSARLIESEQYLANACRYVWENPVRAGIRRHPRDWPWSSYRASFGLEPAPDFLSIDDLLDLFGLRARRTGRTLKPTEWT
jgi:REP-associated tyrosine transposase